MASRSEQETTVTVGRDVLFRHCHPHGLAGGGGDQVEPVGGVAADVDEHPDVARTDAGGDAGEVGSGKLGELLARDEVARGGRVGE